MMIEKSWFIGALIVIFDEVADRGKEAAKKEGHPVDGLEILHEVILKYNPDFVDLCKGCEKQLQHGTLMIDEYGNFIFENEDD